MLQINPDLVDEWALMKELDSSDEDEIYRDSVLVGDCDEELEDGFWFGTTTFAMVLDKCIILGSDKEKGNHSGLTKKVTEKTFRLGKLPVGYTRSGKEDDTKKLMDLLDKYVSEGGTDITVIPDHVIDNTPTKHAAHLLVGGYNEGSDTPHLYYISKDGVINITSSNISEIRGRFQTGTGKGAAFVWQNEVFYSGMSEEERIRLLVETIWNAIKNDKHTGKGIEYVVIRADEALGEGRVTVNRMSLDDFERARGL